MLEPVIAAVSHTDGLCFYWSGTPVFMLHAVCTGSGKVVHVKNLAYTASQEQLKELFTGVEDIHMPLQANGKSRG